MPFADSFGKSFGLLIILLLFVQISAFPIAGVVAQEAETALDAATVETLSTEKSLSDSTRKIPVETSVVTSHQVRIKGTVIPYEATVGT